MRTGIIFLLTAACAACSSQPAPDNTGIDWVRYSAEYQAVSRQAFRAATLALPEMIADTGWSALPGQHDAADLQPAIILDVDETSLTNPIFQASFEPPFTEKKLDDWSIEHEATPAPGSVDFLQLAQDFGVQIIFVTNRACVANDNDSCPQKRTVIDDLAEAGLPADESNVTLSGERENWGKEKQTRREHFAKDYRIIMLFGDDLSDFIPCVRSRPAGACTAPATAESRAQLMLEYGAYWGAGMVRTSESDARVVDFFSAVVESLAGQSPKVPNLPAKLMFEKLVGAN